MNYFEKMKTMENLNNTIDDVINFCEIHRSDEKITFLKFLRAEYGFTFNDAVDLVNYFKYKYDPQNDHDLIRFRIEKALTNTDRDLKNSKDKRSLWNNFFIPDPDLEDDVPENEKDAVDKCIRDMDRYIEIADSLSDKATMAAKATVVASGESDPVPEKAGKHVPFSETPSSETQASHGYKVIAYGAGGAYFNVTSYDDAKALEVALAKVSNIYCIEIVEIKSINMK